MCMYMLFKVVGNLPSLQEIHGKHMHHISKLYGPLPSLIMSAVSSSGINSMSSFFTLIVINRPFPATHVIFEMCYCHLLPFEGLGVCFLTLVSRLLKFHFKINFSPGLQRIVETKLKTSNDPKQTKRIEGPASFYVVIFRPIY